MKNIIGIKKAAKIIGVSTARVRVFAIEKRLPGKLLEGRWIFEIQKVEAFAKEKRPAGNPNLKKISRRKSLRCK
jgi:hypothetical protein